MRRAAVWVVLLSLASAVGAFRYAAENLGINADTDDLISSDLPWRQNYRDYQRTFPQHGNNLVVVIDAATPDRADMARERLAERLSQADDLIEWVYVPGGGEFFATNGLLYLDVGELESLTDRLAAVQPFLARLAADPTLRGFFAVLRDALDAGLEDEAIELSRVMESVAEAVDAVLAGRFHRLSWWELMQGRDAEPEERRRFLIVKPVLDYDQLLPVGEVMEHIRGTARELDLDPAHGVRVRITGGLALSHEELESLSRGMAVAALAAFVTVMAILTVGLRSLRLVVASLVTLAVGLLWTAAFATAAVGSLNLISVAFAVLYIGLGVQYAVHFCLRYRELRLLGGLEHADALATATSDVGRALTLCALTTGIGFFAFVPTDFVGVSQLGLISGTGVFISLLATLSVLPALITVMPPRVKPREAGATVGMPQSLVTFPSRHRRAVLLVTLLAAVAAAATLPAVSFDRNPLNLRDPSMESVATYRELIAESERPPWTMIVVTEAVEAKRLSERLEALEAVDFVIDVGRFVPAEQPYKLGLIEELGLILGMSVIEWELAGGGQPEPTLEEQLAALRGLRAELAEVAPQASWKASAARLHDALVRLERRLAADPAQASGLVERLEESLLAALPAQLERLAAALEAEPVSLESLPEALRERWVAPDGRRLLEVVPAEDLQDNAALERFVSEVREAVPSATGSPLTQLESGRAVVNAFRQAFLSALIAITLLLAVLLKSVRDVLLVLTPLLLAGLFTVAATVVLGMPFNFANVITLPLLLGIGVDNGIHMVYRMRIAPPAGGHILQSSTTRAVVVSALTTIGSFGTLAYSAHRGTASMGQLLSIGLAMTLVCTLVVLPVMLAQWRRT